MSNLNPYAVTGTVTPNIQQPMFAGDPADVTKIHAIIRDASQFWLAIIICLFCGIIGSLIIPIWYSVRMVQWRAMAAKYPALMAADAEPGSLSQKFQSSQWKLVVGLVFGFSLMLLFIGYIGIVMVVAISQQP